MRKTSFPQRVIKRWNGLPRAVDTTPGLTELNTLKQRVGAGLNGPCGSLPTLNVQPGNTATDQVLQVPH